MRGRASCRVSRPPTHLCWGKERSGMDRGYIKLWRKFKDNELWKEPRVFSKWEAWLDLISEAQWQAEDKPVLIRNTVYQQKQGEVLKSTRTWARKWRWSESRVRRFLKLLKKRRMIDAVDERQTTRITIVNFVLYNNPRRSNDAQSDAQSDAPATHPRRSGDAQAVTTKEGKEGKEGKEKKEELLDESKYPKKDEVVQWWNKEIASLGDIRPIRAMTGGTNGKGRWPSFKRRCEEGLWKEKDLIKQCFEESPFLLGEVEQEGVHSNWRASFDWLLGTDKNATPNWLNIVEGKYNSEDGEQNLTVGAMLRRELQNK